MTGDGCCWLWFFDLGSAETCEGCDGFGAVIDLEMLSGCKELLLDGGLGEVCSGLMGVGSST